MSDMSNTKIAFFIIGGIGILGLLTAMVVYLSMNNKNLKELSDETVDTKEIKIFENKNLTGNAFGEKVSLEYDSGKRYKIINVSGTYDTREQNPRIYCVFSDDGNNWSIPGDSEIASISSIGNTTNFMMQYKDVPFKFVTVYVQLLVNNITCSIRLSN
tara:strand:+ start:476 stop:949 length:474 start_codon:yes stop_codon:yes gene_type:complete